MQPHCQISGQKSLTKSSEWLSQHVMTMLQWNFKFYHVMFLRSLKAGRKILQSSCDCCYSHITYFTTCLFSLVVACRKWMTVETRKESKSQKQEENSAQCLECMASGLLRLDSVVETSSNRSNRSNRSGGLGPLQCLAEHRGGLEGTQLSGPRRFRRRQSVLVALGLLRMPGKAWSRKIQKNHEKCNFEQKRVASGWQCQDLSRNLESGWKSDVATHRFARHVGFVWAIHVDWAASSDLAKQQIHS